MVRERSSEEIYCWQIMECGEDNCPVRLNKIKRCWERMAQENGYQCEYGLCEDCIIYLSKNKQLNFSYRDLEQILKWRAAARNY